MKKNFSLVTLLLLCFSATVFAQPFYLRGSEAACGWGNSDAACELTDLDADGVFTLVKNYGTTPVGRQEFKVYDAGTDTWHPNGANAWFDHKGGSVTFRIKASNGEVEAKDGILTVCAPGEFSGWDNATAMVKTGNVFCYTIPTPGTYQWKPTFCGSWDSWQPCNGERSKDSGNWYATTIAANEQICVTYNPTTGRVTQNAKLTLTNTKVDVKCQGAATGSINLSVVGSAAPYQYLWSNGATDEDPTGLAAGVYSVTVNKAGFCPVSRSVTITEPASAVAFTYAVVATSATKFKVTLTGSGGTPTYKYRRSKLPTGYTAWGTNPAFLNLVAGTYIFEIQDKNLCVSSQTVVVGANAPMAGPEVADRGPVTEQVSLSISPNPAHDFLTVKIAAAETSGTLVVMDALGRTVLEQTAGENVRLSLTGFHAGTYSLSFRGDNGTVINKYFVVGL